MDLPRSGDRLRERPGEGGQVLGAPRRTVRREALLWLAATAAALAAITFDLVPRLRGPAPYPPEWQWLRRAAPASGPLWPALVVGVAVMALLWLSNTAAARRHARRAFVAIVSGAVAAGFAFQLAILEREPEGALQALFGQVVYRTATSYYTVAVSEDAHDPVAFLRRHHELLPRLVKAGKHASTHPPGPVLLFRGLIALFERSPALTRAVLATTGFREVNPDRPRPQHTAASRAAALTGGLLIALFGAATAWPVASLARSAGAEPLTASRVGVLWAVLPGPALMTPMLDQALALPVAGSAACLAAAAATPDRPPRALALAVAAGALGGLATLTSYGAPVFLAVGGLAALALAPDLRSRWSRAVTLALTAAAVSLALFLLPAALGHHPLASLATALEIHREQFTVPRRYLLWLFFNPLDLALFLGVPVAVAWIARTAHSLTRPLSPLDHMRIATALALLVVVLSGQTRGEVGRIWIPLMPPLLVAALAGPGAPTRSEAIACAACLVALCLTMATFWQLP